MCQSNSVSICYLFPSFFMPLCFSFNNSVSFCISLLFDSLLTVSPRSLPWRGFKSYFWPPVCNDHRQALNYLHPCITTLRIIFSLSLSVFLSFFLSFCVWFHFPFQQPPFPFCLSLHPCLSVKTFFLNTLWRYNNFLLSFNRIRCRGWNRPTFASETNFFFFFQPKRFSM